MLAAEAGSRESDGQAFESLMKFIGDIHDVNKNPLFQALKVGDKALPAVKVSSICINRVPRLTVLANAFCKLMTSP